MTTPLKILLLEDNPADAGLVQRMLEKEHPGWQFRVVIDEAGYGKALEEYIPDVILCDNDLPQFNAMEALHIIRQRGLFIPFILVTGAVSDEFAAGIIRQGADDYVLKDRLSRLPAAIEAAVKQREIEREKREAVETLIESEKKYRTIFANSPLPKWIYDVNTLEFLEVNNAAIRHYGFTKEEFLQMTILDIRPPEDRQQVELDLQQIEYDPDLRKGNWRHRKKNGEIIIVEITAHSIPYRNRNARMVVVHDVTERVRTDREKAFAANNLAALINNTNDLMWSVDTDFRLITSNDAFNRMVEKIIGRRLQHGDSVLHEHFRPDQLMRYRKWYGRAFSGEGFTIIERFDQPVRFYSEISFYPIRQGNQVIGTACFSRDITERKRAEEELRAMETQLTDQKLQAQKKVTRAIIEGQERERNHIGKELHDNANQIFASAKMYLSLAERESPEGEAKELVKQAMDLIEIGMHEIRSLTSGYVAPMKNINLQELIHTLLDKLADNAEINSSFTYEIGNFQPDDELKRNLYRIVQEEVNNIVKHSDATRIDITISADDHFLYLATADNGKGFDPNKRRMGIGISNIINRVELFNGEVNIESSPGAGCHIYIKIPRRMDEVPVPVRAAGTRPSEA